MAQKGTPYQRENKRALAKESRIRVRVIAGIVGVFFLIGLLFPLRPKESAAEKRKLAEFPKMTFAALSDGSYFTDLETWYSETYPLREVMIKLNTKWTRIYGVRSSAIYGAATAEADEIPEAGTTAAPIMTMDESAESSAAGSGQTADSQSGGTAAESGTDGTGADGQNGDPADSAGSGEDAQAGTESQAEDNTEYEDGSIHAVPEEFGTVYLADGRGFGIYYFLQSGVDAYASMLNTVRARLPENVKMYSMPVPTGYGVLLSPEAQASLGGSDMAKALDYLFSIEDPKIIQVPILQAEINHNAEYTYFYTDHHWTALGAWYAYCEYAKAAGFAPHDLSMFEKKTFPNFLGSYYYYSNQAPELAANKDTIDAYVPMGTNEMKFVDTEGIEYDWPIISDATNFPEDSKYMCFIAGDRPFSEIHNPQITDGSAVVVIKESYGNAFVPFLVDHYQDVYVIDHRYYSGNLTQFIKDNGVDDVIFMNHMSALTEGNAQSMINIFPG